MNAWIVQLSNQITVREDGKRRRDPNSDSLISDVSVIIHGISGFGILKQAV